MPLELGLFFGAKKFGGRDQTRKKLLILDREPFRYQQFISDISGQDIHSHQGQITPLIQAIATWLRDEVGEPRVPGGLAMADEFERFQADLPSIAATKELHPDELTFKDLTAIAARWILAEDA
jgi:hypothetical protein